MSALADRIAAIRSRKSALDLDEAALRAIDKLTEELGPRVQASLEQSEVVIRVRLFSDVTCDTKYQSQPAHTKASERWTEREDEKAVQMSAAGMDTHAIAEAMERSEAGVVNRLRKLSLRVRRAREAAARLKDHVSEEPPSATPEKPQPLKSTRSNPQPWSPYDDRIALEMHREGRSHDEIGNTLGRTPGAVRYRINHTLAPRRRDAAPASAPESTKPPEAVSERPADADRISDSEIGLHLDQIGGSDFWTPQRDHQLVQMLLSGTKADQVSVKMEVEKNVVVDRFRTLCPWSSFEDQRRLLDALRRRTETRNG